MSEPLRKRLRHARGWWMWASAVCVGLVLILYLWQHAFRRWWWEPEVGGYPVAHWVEGLCSPDYQVRDRAEAVLGRSGSESVPGLIRILRYREPSWAHLWRRWAPRWALSNRERPSVEAMRACAARTVGGLGAAGGPASDALVEVLSDPSEPVSAAASEAQAALRKIGDPALAALGRGLRHGKAIARARVADLLCTTGNFSRSRLEQELGPLLEAALRDQDAMVRGRAVSAIGALGVFSSAVLGRLGILCGSQEVPEVRVAALSALGLAGSKANGQLAAVEHALGAAQPEVRLEASRAAWKLVEAGVNEHVVKRVLETLGALVREGGYRWQAALAVGEMGEAGAPLIPDLVRAMRDEMPHRPSRTPPVAAVALGRMGAPARPALLELIRDPEPWVRLSAGVALLGHGAGAAAAVPDLIRMLDEPENEARIVASQVLGSVGPAAAGALPRLNVLAQSQDEYVRSAATGAIGRIRIRSGGTAER